MNTQDSLPAPSTAACEIARLSRDARFDGVFFTAVLSTRIYCRPVCPARPPKAENVVYYPSAAAAQAQGFRPCLRCRPELAPGNQLWLHGEHLVARALKLINEGYLADHSLETLAEHAAAMTDTFMRLPEQYQDNLISVADLIFVGRSMERMAEGLQKVVAEALYAAS